MANVYMLTYVLLQVFRILPHLNMDQANKPLHKTSDMMQSEGTKPHLYKTGSAWSVDYK